MRENVVRVLHVLNSMESGGIESFIMNVYRNIDREKIQFDFLLFEKTDSCLEKEIISLGGHLFFVPSRRKSIIRNIKAIDSFFKKNSYKIVHMHVSCLSYITPLVCAKKNKVPVRIIHSHSSVAPGNKIHFYLHLINKKRICSVATHFFACSDKAQEWLFKGSKAFEKSLIVKNGIDCAQFRFDNNLRSIYRKKLNLSDKKTIIHVGRFAPEKNHQFLIQVFKKFHSQNPQSHLLLVGNGIEFLKVKQLVNDEGLADCVSMLGLRNDVAELLHAADMYVLPSLYEGFPVALIEAQATGIPCLYSNTITASAKILPNCKQIPIFNGPDVWASALSDNAIWKREERGNSTIIEAGYSIKDVAVSLAQVYLESVVKL